MNEQNFLRALRAVEEYELENAPQRHPRQTDKCPSLVRLTHEHYTGWSDELKAHLKGCEFCREQAAYLAELDEQDRKVAAARATLMIFVARQMLIRFRPVQRFDDQPRELPFVRLDFENDDRVHADLSLDGKGRHWLDVKPDGLSPGTLLRVRIEGGDSPSWARFVMLRSGFKEKPIARICVDDALGETERELAIDVYPSASALTVGDSGPLKESFATAQRDDPNAVTVWKQWAASSLEQSDVPVEVMEVLREIANAGPVDPPGTGRMATAKTGPAHMEVTSLPHSA